MSKRRPLHASMNNSSFKSTYSNLKNTNMNFRPNSMQEDRGGTRPIAAPSSVGLILVTMVVHVCKKSLLYEPRLKAVIYLAIIFLVSIIADFFPIPKTYFARSNNILNRFFIKWAWGWLLTTVGPWIMLTAHTIGCGRRSIVLKHLVRLIFATGAWMLWMNIFHYVETNYGRCVGTKQQSLQSKSKCLQAGLFWSGLDISGHAFIIIYSTLILSEEGHSLLGWEGIKDFIMNEEYNRRSCSDSKPGYLKYLSDSDLDFLKTAHKALTPYLRGLFIVMTLQQIIWDVMLTATVLYYHIMIEKFVGAVAAILTWYVSYYWLFRLPNIGILLPGEGIFKYNDLKEKFQDYSNKTKRVIPNKGQTFMGMPVKNGKEFNSNKPSSSMSMGGRSGKEELNKVDT